MLVCGWHAGLADQANVLCCPYAGGGREIRETKQAGAVVTFPICVGLPRDIIWGADVFRDFIRSCGIGAVCAERIDFEDVVFCEESSD
jgi:hypothetical protein